MSLGEEIAKGIQSEMDMNKGIGMIATAIIILVAFFVFPKWGVPVACAGMILNGLWLIVRYVFQW
jgi:hypothetical protein